VIPSGCELTVDPGHRGAIRDVQGQDQRPLSFAGGSVRDLLEHVEPPGADCQHGALSDEVLRQLSADAAAGAD